MFTDRTDAGRQLAQLLLQYSNTNSMVLAIPRGGVPVGYEIAKRLNVPLDVVLAKKIGHPLNEEYAIGAISTDVAVMDDHPEVPEEYVKQKTKAIRAQLAQRLKMFRGTRPALETEGKNIILTDDGIATGNTMLACLQTLKKNSPARIIVAVPVSTSQAETEIRKACDEYICLETPEYFPGVGYFYKDFRQVSDEEVQKLLFTEPK